jgi:two-component system sensor histidine kinase/response regulator
MPDQLPHEPLDRRVLAQLRELGEQAGSDILAELVPSFLDDADAQLRALGAAVADADVDTVVRIAHRLKGSCATIGAQRASHICSELEQLAHSRDLGSGADLVRDLAAELKVAQARLDEEIHR